MVSHPPETPPLTPSSHKGARLRFHRLRRGVSESDLAGAMGVSVAELADIEAGRRNVSSFLLARAAERLVVPMRSLLPSEPTVYLKAEEALFDVWASTGRSALVTKALDFLWLDEVLNERLEREHPGWFDAEASSELAAAAGFLPAAVPNGVALRALWAYHLGLVGVAVPAAAAGRVDREVFRAELADAGVGVD